LGVAVKRFPPTHFDFVLGQNNIALDSVVFLLVAGSQQFLISLYGKDKLAHLYGSGSTFLYAFANGGNLTGTQEERNLAVSVELSHLFLVEAESFAALTGITHLGHLIAL
jgi:hypothetical protein